MATPSKCPILKIYPICIITANSEITNNKYDHFFRNNKPIEPNKPEKTAIAKAAVNQAGKLDMSSICSSVIEARQASVLYACPMY